MQSTYPTTRAQSTGSVPPASCAGRDRERRGDRPAALALCEELLEWAEFLGLNTAEYRDEYTRLATAYMAKTGLKIS